MKPFSGGNMNDKSAIAKKFAQMYGGPILIPYVDWILSECRKKQINKLFFIARDGYVLKLIADYLIKRNNDAIQTSYIYGSRRVWRVAYLLQEDLDIVRFLDESYREKIIGINKLASLFLIEPDELKPFLPAYYQENQSEWTVIDVYLIQNYLNKLKKFKTFLHNRLFDLGERAKGYLLQEVGEITQEIAFVESVGTGYTQGGLEILVNKVGEIQTFYYYQHNKKGKRKYYSYIKDENKSSIMIELLCRSCEGQTNDYKKHNGKYVPVFKDNEGKALAEYGYESYFEEIQRIAEQFKGNTAEKKEEIWDSFSKMENKEMLKYIGDFPYGVTGAEHKLCTFAPKITLQQIKHILLSGKIFTEQRYYSGANISYSIKRSNLVYRKLAEISEKNKCIRRQQDKRIYAFENKSDVSIVEIFPEITGKKAVVYGAGKIGNYLVSSILESEAVQLMLWIDQFPRYSNLFSISKPEEILKTEFDYVIIGSVNWGMSKEMKDKLNKLGVDRSKIIG